MSYLNYDGLAYFKSKLTNWVDQNYLSKTNTGNLTVAGHVTFTNSITGDLDGKAKKDWLGQKIDETYIKEIATNDNAGTIVYTKGNGSTNHILIDLLQGATPIANGRAGLVPAPTVSEMNYFLRGDGNWAVPTDVYVNQNLIASSNNNQFPVLLSGTSGTPATKTNATVGYTNVVSVNPLTNALMASQFISKHPTYNRQNAITSKVQYSLNFTDIVSGAGHNLGEVVGYVDTLANGGEHELGLRLFGNPNVQGTEEDYVYMGVGLSKTNVAYGHAPSTPLPSAHNEPTDIITRDWLARNGSETGLVHTTMNETIDGTKTFVKKIVANDGMNATGDIATDTLTVRQDATVGRDLAVTRNETVGGTLTTTGNISTANGNISTTNGTISGKTGSIGTGGLTVTGPSNLNGKVTAGNGLDVTGNTETDTLTVNGNETVGGTLTVTGKITGNGGVDTTTLHATDDVIADDDLTVGDTVTVGGQILKKTGTNTTQEYVSYITNQEGSRTTIINNMADTYTIKNNNSKLSVNFSTIRSTDLANITPYVIDPAGGLSVDSSSKKLKVDFKDPDPDFIQGIVENMIDWSGGLAAKPEGYLLAGEYYTDNKGVRRRVTAAQATEQFTGSDGETYYGMKDPNSGKLVVDFSKIDEDTKADILATLDLQYPLTVHLYVTVDPNGVSEDEVTYGIAATDALTHKVAGKWINYTFKERKSIPFKTIQGAVNWVSSRVNLANKNAYIDVVAGTYEESVNLPQLARSTGYAVIRTKSGLKDVVIKPPKTSGGYYGHAFYASSGACVWHIYHMTCDKRLGEVSTATGIATPGMGAGVSGAIVHLHGCDFIVRPEHLDETDPNSAERTEFVGQIYTVRLIDADGGGTVHLHPDKLGANINVKLPEVNTEGIIIDVLNVARDGTMYFRKSNPPEDMYDENDTAEQKAAKDEIFASYYVNGSFTHFIYTWQAGKTNALGGSGLYIKFPVASNGTAVGRPYVLTGGSHIISPEKVYLDNDPESGTYQQYYYVFPGNGTTSIQTNTYCWIDVENNYPSEEPNNG